MDTIAKSPKYLKVLFLVITGIMGTQYFSHDFNLLAVVSFLTALLIIWENRLKKTDLKIFALYILVNAGVIISKLLFTPDISTVVNVGFVLKTITFGLIVIHFLNNYTIPKSFLFIVSLFALPHFIGYLLGILPPLENMVNVGQFGGFHGDPNYLSPDLLAAFSAQLFIINLKFSSYVKTFTYFNIGVTCLLILYTGSRTAILSTILIIILYAIVLVKNRGKGKVLLYTSLLGLGGLYFGDYILQYSPQAEFIFERFFYTEGGASLQENERFITWGLAYDVISKGELFEGYGMNNFLERQYRMLSHNVFLNAGIVYGKYTFYAHILAISIGLSLYIIKLIRGSYKIGFNTSTYLFVFVVSQIFMMNSISVAYKYFYWFVIVIVVNYGFFTPKKYNKSPSDRFG